MNLASEQIDQIVPALIKAKGEFKAAVKDSTNPHFKSKYVALDGVIDAVGSAFQNNDIFCAQQTDVVDGRIVLYTRFLHVSGQWIGGAYPVHPVKNDPQGEGSALTYARRYALMALAGIAPEDDDGNAATEAAKRQQAESRPEARTIAGTPTGGVWESLDEDEQEFLQKIADQVVQIIASGDIAAAYDHLQTQQLTSDERVALWTRLDSKQRSALKRADAAAKSKQEIAA